MARSCTMVFVLVAALVFSAVARSPVPSPTAAVAAPPEGATHKAPAPSTVKTPPAAAPSPSSVVSSPPSPPQVSAPSPSPSVPTSSISAPPIEAPAPSQSGAVSNRFAVAGSVALGLVAIFALTLTGVPPFFLPGDLLLLFVALRVFLPLLGHNISRSVFLRNLEAGSLFELEGDPIFFKNVGVHTG
ncbi:hypothetical protein RJT34_13445 [Clitoria ternatea]|uniref:Uncharacterized protein n=1 Tax=Clitoria ternatea TaxID=43366 RepID=A0AAN9PLQ7_CLITE